MTGMLGILCQPAFQALPDRITQMLDHLDRGHRRSGIQVHRAPSFLGTEHTIILSFSLPKNVRIPYPGLWAFFAYGPPHPALYEKVREGQQHERKGGGREAREKL